MGNYHNIETEFVDRTLRLIDQYYSVLDGYPFEEQFNYTLTINCLLGLIVMPNERVISYVPTNRLTRDYLTEIGSPSLEVGAKINTLRHLIKALRNAVAHFDIAVISEDEKNLVDWLEFSDSENDGALVARFRASELLSFLRYYAHCLLANMERYRG
ncbi:HEPN family nuclease [Vreelandella titanicae]|uniref:HEPN family nuclease n=1 Tax=Vreelandella titanicae TaxID=664683 RepID=UPI0039BEE8B4